MKEKTQEEYLAQFIEDTIRLIKSVRWYGKVSPTKIDEIITDQIIPTMLSLIENQPVPKIYSIDDFFFSDDLDDKRVKLLYDDLNALGKRCDRNEYSMNSDDPNTITIRFLFVPIIIMKKCFKNNGKMDYDKYISLILSYFKYIKIYPYLSDQYTNKLYQRIAAIFN